MEDHDLRQKERNNSQHQASGFVYNYARHVVYNFPLSYGYAGQDAGHVVCSYAATRRQIRYRDLQLVFQINVYWHDAN